MLFYVFLTYLSQFKGLYFFLIVLFYFIVKNFQVLAINNYKFLKIKQSFFLK